MKDVFDVLHSPHNKMKLEQNSF